MPRDAVSRTANVGTVGTNGLMPTILFAEIADTHGAYKRLVGSLGTNNYNFQLQNCILYKYVFYILYIPLMFENY